MIETGDRSFKNPRAFHRHVIKNWNKQAKKGDTIYVIGDLFDYHYKPNYNWEDNFKIIKKIKADIILLIGNNEERIIKEHFNDDFEAFRLCCMQNGITDVLKNATIKVCDIDFYMTHKAKDCNMEMLNLFGHSHKAMGIYKTFGFNVFYDLHDYKLVDEKRIKHLLHMKKVYWSLEENLTLI